MTITSSGIFETIRHPGPKRSTIPHSAWLACILLIAYPTSTVLPPVYENLVVADILLFLVYILFFPLFWKEYLQFLATGYFYASLIIVSFMSASLIVTNPGGLELLAGMKALAQLLAVIWLLIPLIAVGIAQLKRPARFLEAGAWASIALLVSGAVLWFMSGSDLLMINSGVGRYKLRIHPFAFEACVIPLAVASLTLVPRLFSLDSLRSLALLAGGVFQAVLGDFRTSLLTAGFIIIVGFVLQKRRLLSIILILLQSVLFFLLTQDASLAEDLGIRKRELFRDDVRLEVMEVALEKSTGSVSAFLFGSGWHASGFETPVAKAIVHNIFLQVMVEWGLLGMLGWVYLWILPWVWILRVKEAPANEWQLLFLVLTGIYIGWMFHPIPTTRGHWLSFAVALGLAYRARNATNAHTSASQHTPQPQNRSLAAVGHLAGRS